MNKAFVREPEQTADYCPRCGSKGQPVGQGNRSGPSAGRRDTNGRRSGQLLPVSAVRRGLLRLLRAGRADGGPLPAGLSRDPDAPICACFGLTRRDIERDVSEGVVARVRAIVEKAQSPEARSAEWRPTANPASPTCRSITCNAAGPGRRPPPRPLAGGRVIGRYSVCRSAPSPPASCQWVQCPALAAGSREWQVRSRARSLWAANLLGSPGWAATMTLTAQAAVFVDSYDL